MPKNAVIVSGSHFAGKSHTLRDHLKPKLSMSKGQRNFTRNGLKGTIRTQSFEEAGWSSKKLKELLKSLADFDLIVVATRPKSESGSLFNQVYSELMELGFRVEEIVINNNNPPKNPSYYGPKADEILNHLDKP